MMLLTLALRLGPPQLETDDGHLTEFIQFDAVAAGHLIGQPSLHSAKVLISTLTGGGVEWSLRRARMAAFRVMLRSPCCSAVVRSPPSTSVVLQQRRRSGRTLQTSASGEHYRTIRSRRSSFRNSFCTY